MSADDICAGDRLGEYELLVPIAKGGTAEVWAARRTGPEDVERIFALKVMLAEFSDDTDAESMFLDEARVVSRISSPHVGEVLDFGEHASALFLVMDWVDGEQLNVVAREARGRGGLPLPIVVGIVQQASAGLQAAHELVDDEGNPVGLVHRDVSPQNILVGYDGTVKVIDFGVAKAAWNQQRTNVGQLKGKVAYMAPEQAVGLPVDRRTDIFALGVVFYQLITGKHPFRADNEFATLARVRDGRPVDPPSMHLKSIPEGIEQVILKALAKERSERFATMLEFSRALEEAFPLVDNGAEEIASYMRSLLGHRGEKKRLAIREAIRAADEHVPALNTVPPAFDPGRSFDFEDGRATPNPQPRTDWSGLFTPSGEWLDPRTSRPSLEASSRPSWGGARGSGSLPSINLSGAGRGSALSAPGPLDDRSHSGGGGATSAWLLWRQRILAELERLRAIPKFLFELDRTKAVPRSVLGLDRAKAEAIQTLRARPLVGFIAGVMTIMVLAALTIWAVSGDSSDPGTTSGQGPK